jgi:ubiquinone biosynthesis monooxygenase Coq7
MTYRPQKIPQLFRQFATSTKISPKEARENITRDRFLRVDHAGEVGADRIYAGQMAVLGICPNGYMNIRMMNDFCV